MTSSRQQWRAMSVTAVVAVALAVASCEAPRPEPLAPGESVPTPTVNQVQAEPYFEFQVERPVTMAAGSDMPKYPQILRVAGVEGQVLVSFVVDPSGQADVSTLKVIRSTHDLFATAVKTALPAMRFVPAEVGGRKVSQLVQQPFRFTLPGAFPRDASSGADSVREVPVQGRPFVIRRPDQMVNLPSDPTTIILSSSGTEVARYAAKGKVEEIRTDDISAIEVYKGRGCPSSEQATCPQIRITLKPGREAAYRKR